ncbi:hypothetical protein KSX_89410 [Ktedonospora formicarum]|uniref:Uncharacterized protein n=1 Tax=Ktedonospora formicarum TaxID=2778364 RepID=A0A8J3IEB0_9CHLR|nr:hypothetical protein KSX_89410 [Ktedonospora formicarum]
MLKNYQVGIWCKRAAWIQLVLHLVYMIIQFSLVLVGRISPLSSAELWSEVQILISTASTTLFDFFILYAAGVAVEHLVPSIPSVRTDEDDEDEMSD